MSRDLFRPWWIYEKEEAIAIVLVCWLIDVGVDHEGVTRAGNRKCSFKIVCRGHITYDASHFALKMNEHLSIA